MHSSYSADLASSVYHLLLSMSNAQRGIKLAAKLACENWLSEYFRSYERGIMKLPSQCAYFAQIE